jgi:single-stranded DNA-specific DHH superfamily exonuclease
MKTIPHKTAINGMSISAEKLSKFIKLFEQKTGRKLKDAEALIRAKTLLQTVYTLYKPVSEFDYYSADVAYPFFERKNYKPEIKSDNIIP